MHHVSSGFFPTIENVASSLIRINEATFEELQTLPSIGPKRARRIIEYRETVSPLADHDDLVKATRMPASLAMETSQWIDWNSETQASIANLIFAGSATIACLSLCYYAVQGYSGDTGAPAAILYFVCVFLILTGSLAAILRQCIANLHRASAWSGWIAFVALCSGVVLLASLMFAIWLIGAHDGFARHVMATGELTIFVAIILALVFAPGWYARSASNHQRTAAHLFDLGQSLLAAVMIALLTLRTNPTLTELLFGLWAGVTLLVNAREMTMGRSSYCSNLAERDRAVLAVQLHGEPRLTPKPVDHRLLRPAGWLLVSLSALLLATSLRILITGWISR